MSAHFIPFTEHTENNEDAWFDGFLGMWCGCKAWELLAEYVRDDEDLYQGVNDLHGWVSPDTIKEFADRIRDLDVNTLIPPSGAIHFYSYTDEEKTECLLACLNRLKDVILDCAEKGRGILHFH